MNVGLNLVLLMVIDLSGNIIICEIIVIVVDDIVLVVLCQDIIIELDNDGVVEVFLE